MEPPKVPDPTYTTGRASSRRPCLHCRAHTRSPTQRNYWTCALSSSSLVVITVSNAESELLRDNDPGGLNLTTLVLEEAPQVSGRLVQKDPLGGGLGSWGWSKTPTNRQTVPFKLGKICPVRA